MSQNRNEGLGGTTSGGGSTTGGAGGTGSTGGGSTTGEGGMSGSGGGSTSGGASGGQGMTTTGAGGTGTGGGQGTGTGLAATAQEYGQRIAEAAGSARDYVSDRVAPVVDKIKDIQNLDVNEVANQAKDYARQNPGQAMLISAAAGLLIGLLIRTGSRR
jgi:ElaB/YqjD/DUF883 family membrane-anchored ribosome-binding protein